jgi:multiple antibiotic resistance protein
MTLLSATILLFLILDPVGNVPFFLAVLKDVPAKRRLWIIAREVVIALVALLVFLFSGKAILSAMQIQQESLSIGGGIILFLISLQMIFEGRGMRGDVPGGEPLVVPLAIPGVAGPSAFAMVLLLVSREPERFWEWLVALLIAWLATSLILMASTLFFRLLGERGLVAMERLMGMLLVVVAVQMFLGGLSSYLAG